MGKVNEGLLERGSWCGIKRSVGMSFFDAIVVGSGMVVVAITLGSAAGAAAEGAAVMSGRENDVRSSVPVAARRLVMEIGPDDVEESVEVGCGCGATLERPLCPPTVGSHPLVGISAGV